MANRAVWGWMRRMGEAVESGVPALGPPQRVGILLPTLNEELGLARTLEELPLGHLRLSGYDPVVVVVDGHSTDRTQEVARAFGATVVEQTGQGKGAAMREGLAWASAHGIESVAVLDADFTYPAAGISPIFALLSGGSDLVVGVRRPENDPTSSPRDLVHRLGNGMLNNMAALLSHRPVLDICSGLWGVRTKAIEGLRLVSDGFEIEAELFLKAFRAGLKVAQIPIAYRERVGTAKLRAGQDGARILLAIFRHARTRPIKRAAGRPDQSMGSEDMSQIEALVLATGAKELVVYSDPGRRSDAFTLAQKLRAAQLGTNIVIRSRELNVGSESGASLFTSGVSGGSRGPIMVTLPEMISGEEPVAVVGLPRTQRVVWVGGDSTPALPMLGPFERAGGYRLNRSFSRRLQALALLNASLDPSPRIRELALLGANGRSSRMRVYEYVQPAQSPNGTPPSIVPPSGVGPTSL